MTPLDTPLVTVDPGRGTAAAAAGQASLEEWMEWLGLQGKAVLTIAETAALLRICERSVREGIKAGWIPHVRLGRRVLVPVPRLVAMLAEPDGLAEPTDAR